MTALRQPGLPAAPSALALELGHEIVKAAIDYARAERDHRALAVAWGKATYSDESTPTERRAAQERYVAARGLALELEMRLHQLATALADEVEP